MESEYDVALGFLLGLPDWERGTGTRETHEELLLARPAALLARLGTPQGEYRVVLIAGTKGKGSTAAMLERILRAAGYKTGLYTSPHLHSYRERIRVNGEMITEDEFAEGVGRIQKELDALAKAQPELSGLSTFEAMTALALDSFARREVQIAVLEVGLGGRLDATNVVDADLSVITRISFDHMAVLGNTLAQIAREKAGIIKYGKPVLSAPQEIDVIQVLQEVARERDAVLGEGGRDWSWSGERTDWRVRGESHVSLWETAWEYAGLYVPLRGAHQLENASLAVAAAETMRQSWGWKIAAEALRTGLAQTEWAGRLEVLQAHDAAQSWIVADGAHNGDSAEKLVRALEQEFEFEKLFLILGVMRDKDLDAIAAPFVGLAGQAWTVQAAHARGRAAGEVAARLNELGILAEPSANVGEALEKARGRAGPRDLICITGSLAVVAEARERFGLAEK